MSVDLGCLGLEAKPKRLHHLEYRPETRVAIFRERLVQTLAREPRVLCQSHHSACPCDVSERRRNQGGIVRRFLKAGLEVRHHVFLGLEVIRSVVAGKLFFTRWSPFPSHISSLPLRRNCQGASDIRILSPLIAAAQQQHENFAALQLVHPVAGAVVDAHLADARTDRLHVTRITQRQAPDARFDPGFRSVICKPFDPRIKSRRLEDADHGASVNLGLHAVNRG